MHYVRHPKEGLRAVPGRRRQDRAKGGEAQFLQGIETGSAAGVVLGLDPSRFLSDGEAMGDQERPARRNRDGFEFEGAKWTSSAQPAREASTAAWSMPPPRVPTNCSPSGRSSISS